MVHHWLSLTVEDDSSTHDGPGMVVGMCMGVFYVDDNMIISMDPEWIQGSINVIFGLLRRVSLMDNVEKYKTTTFHTGEILTGISVE